MHTAQIRANFAQNQPSKQLLRKKRRKSHLMNLQKTSQSKPFRQRRAFAESGAANAVSLYDSSRENGLQESPQTFL